MGTGRQPGAGVGPLWAGGRWPALGPHPESAWAPPAGVAPPGFCIWQLCIAARARQGSWAATHERLPGRRCHPAVVTLAPAGGPRTAGEAHAGPQGCVVSAFAPTRRPITAPPLFVPTNGERPARRWAGRRRPLPDGLRGARRELLPRGGCGAERFHVWRRRRRGAAGGPVAPAGRGVKPSGGGSGRRGPGAFPAGPGAGGDSAGEVSPQVCVSVRWPWPARIPPSVPLHSVPSGSSSLASRGPAQICTPKSSFSTRLGACRLGIVMTPGKGGHSLECLSL